MNGTMYEEGLDKTTANFAALTPLTFIERAAAVYPAMPAVVHGAVRRTWAETYARTRRLASALSARGIGVGDTVAAMLPNIPEMVEAHFGVPMIGAVLNTLNTRLDAGTLAFMLRHGEAKVLLIDREFSAVMREALASVDQPVLVIDVDDPAYTGPGERIGETDYEALLASGDPAFEWSPPSDEWNAICLNYTSGTTGNPKGVVYHHRGAYTNAISNVLEWDMPKHAVYLWTLPMFHCNGWCFPWTVAARAGVNVCLRRIDAKTIFDLIRSEGVTHYCGAPIVQNLLVTAADELKAGIAHRVHAMVAGAAPPAAMIEGMERLGFELTHVYGLTEVYGPATVCAHQPGWDALDVSERARMNARQGVRYHLQDAVSVRDPLTLREVPADGETDHRRDHVPRQHHDEGLPEESGSHPGSVRGRLVPHRRSRRRVPGRLCAHQGSQQGHHHFGRREYFEHRGGRRAVPASGGARRRRRREAGCALGRDAVRIRRAQARRERECRRADRALQGPSRRIQGAARGGVLRASEDVDRQDTEIRAAQTRGLGRGHRRLKERA